MLRLDQALVDRGLCESREKAKRAIIAGQVRVNDQLAHKPSDSVKESDQVALDAPEKFVSRGGFKLEHALDHFKIDVTGHTAIDLGASTGGFTDCLLQRGAAKVYAVDVGQGQLAWKLRRDKRVVLIKPQFEAGKREADRGAGVIGDAAIHERVLRELQAFVEERSLKWRGVTQSPLVGPAGNKEFLALIEKPC